MSDHLDDIKLSRLIDGDLSLTSREAAIDHLRGCAACAERHDGMVGVAAALRLEPAVAWTGSDTEAVMQRLSPRRRPGRVAIAALLSMAMCALVLAEAAPLITAPLALVVALIGTSQALVGTALGPGIGLVLAVAAVAALAPLAAYPLARWR